MDAETVPKSKRTGEGGSHKLLGRLPRYNLVADTGSLGAAIVIAGQRLGPELAGKR